MSDITPPSYIDDGHSFTHRLPPTPPHPNIPHWLRTTQPDADATSIYTGSYIDDGLDLLPTPGPGFGRLNPRFYTHKKRRDERGGEAVWSADMARAVGGDIERSLAQLREVASVEVKRREMDSAGEREGVVRVPAPLRWGAFVIKGEGGRCVVVDERGEYDSGAVGGTVGMEGGRRCWVEAERSSSPAASVLWGNTGRLLGGSEREAGSRRESKSKKKTKTSQTSQKRHRSRPLSQSESSYSSDPVSPSAASPTAFIMTGGLSGWPSPTPSHTVSPARTPVIPHAITWATSPSPHTYSAGSARASRSKSQHHSGRTLPHGWPSAHASRTESGCSSGFTRKKADCSWKDSAGGSRQKKSSGSRQSRVKSGSKVYDHRDQEVGSNYQPSDIIEVVYDETPPGEVSYSQAGWGGSAKGSGWEGSKAGSKSQRSHRWDDEKHSNDGHSNDGGNGDGEWDGFERPKTTSEVSVAGGSERSWPASHHSVHTLLTHRTQRSHTSPRSSRHSPAASSASQAKAGSTVHWGGSVIQSEQKWPTSTHNSEHGDHSWSKSIHGSEKSSPSKYQNGFDEDNASYLNDTWGGIPVRVASPHKSVTGWG